jgi:hypothetical protein
VFRVRTIRAITKPSTAKCDLNTYTLFLLAAINATRIIVITYSITNAMNKGDPNNKMPSRRFRPEGRKRQKYSCVAKISLIRLGILLLVSA